MSDYISREDAIEAITLDQCYKCPVKPKTCCICKTSAAKRIIRSVPAADVRPVVRGEWIAYPILDDMYYQHYSCSVCKRVEAIPHGYDVKKELPFCHCGADMRREEGKPCEG